MGWRDIVKRDDKRIETLKLNEWIKNKLDEWDDIVDKGGLSKDEFHAALLMLTDRYEREIHEITGVPFERLLADRRGALFNMKLLKLAREYEAIQYLNSKNKEPNHD